MPRPQLRMQPSKHENEEGYIVNEDVDSQMIDMNYKVTCETCGAEVVEYLQSGDFQRPDLYLFDVMEDIIDHNLKHINSEKDEVKE